ncbi:CD63 antigen [Papilio machaon]|uniref:Tetraspanin n=1 Tax=Papilio machaon TaxID=76193 RepID=A0A0N0PD86_PAPMA|nr:CD63 antigen [Papilio machaon]
MAKVEMIKGVLYILNVVYAVLGLVTAATGIWFFVQLQEFVTLRNTNHYLLDYRVYWPQVAPWLFILLGLFVMMVALCGYCGANKESRGLLGIYAIFLILIVIGQVITATLIFVFVDGEDTDRFIKDTVYDGYYNSQSNPDVFKSFGRIERKLRCCGANDARDYRSFRNDLPLSCCQDSYYRATCDFTDKEANERLGCAKVAAVYTKIISSSVAGASLIISLIEIVGVVLAWKLFNSLREVEHYITERKEGETEC